LPNIKSAEKRMRQNERQRAHNKPIATRMKSAVKKATAALKTESAVAAVSQAFRHIDKAASAGVIHSNAAARRKSRLAKKLNAASA